MLDGFSADLAYTILSRLVETFQSLFTGSPKSQIVEKAQAIQAGIRLQHNQKKMSTASNLINLKQAISNGATPEELNKKINQLIQDTLPGTEISLEPKVEKTR